MTFWDDILKGITGEYLDIGCYDETLYSNTKLVSLAGWKGIAVDANPDVKTKWLTNRPLDIFYNLAVADSISNQADQDSHLKFYRFQDGAVNTIQKTVAKGWIERGFPFKDVIKVKSLTLEEIAYRIKEDNPSFTPRLVNIDIEQANYLPCLQNFISAMRHPQLLCIEWVNSGFGINNFKESDEVKILESCSYEVVQLIGGNIFAQHKGK